MHVGAVGCRGLGFAHACASGAASITQAWCLLPALSSLLSLLACSPLHCAPASIPFTLPAHTAVCLCPPLLQVIAFLAGLHHSGLFRPSLIVCPATVLRQWLRELRAWWPLFRVALLHDSARSGASGAARPSRQRLIRDIAEVGWGSSECVCV
jgi:hypothetical protein